MADRLSATWYFNLHWQNDQELYLAVLDFARVCLRQVPNMTEQTLGLNVRDTVWRWCVDEAATPLGWQQRHYPVTRAVLVMMREEVAAAGGFPDVELVEVGEAVRESLGVEA